MEIDGDVRRLLRALKVESIPQTLHNYVFQATVSDQTSDGAERGVAEPLP